MSQTTTKTMIQNHHTHNPPPHQSTSILTQNIKAPLPLVWSLVRQFNNPQSYKQFIKSCKIMGSGRGGEIGEGCVREVVVMSGLPAETSIERLDKLDDDLHLMKFSIIGGDHQLKNYVSTTSLHEENNEGGEKWTVVIESYVVDIPLGSCKEDTCSFADTIVTCNLRSLARVCEKMAAD